MAEEIKKIGILTSGGDAPGMNAAVRAVVRAACQNGIECVGIRKGFNGLLDRDFIPLGRNDVADTIHLGGTFLLTARSDRFRAFENQRLCAEILKEEKIDLLVCVGGDGTFEGARRLTDLGAKVMGIPVTIDNDVACTDYTIGFDTAVNTAMEAIDKIRETSTSHERVSIVEVMGRGAGYISLWCGISTGAEDILIPEIYDGDMPGLIDTLEDHIKDGRAKGKTHHIIVNAEGIGHTYEIAKILEERTGVGTRATIIGYMQRGGSPTAKDRVLASLMGAYLIERVMEGHANEIVAVKNDHITSFAIKDAVNMYKDVDSFMIRTAGMMIR